MLIIVGKIQQALPLVVDIKHIFLGKDRLD